MFNIENNDSNLPITESQIDEYLAAVKAEFFRARKYWSGKNNVTALAHAEESGELIKAIMDEPMKNVYKESVQASATAARLALEGDLSVTAKRARKGLDPMPVARAIEQEYREDHELNEAATFRKWWELRHGQLGDDGFLPLNFKAGLSAWQERAKQAFLDAAMKQNDPKLEVKKIETEDGNIAYRVLNNSEDNRPQSFEEFQKTNDFSKSFIATVEYLFIHRPNHHITRSRLMQFAEYIWNQGRQSKPVCVSVDPASVYDKAAESSEPKQTSKPTPQLSVKALPSSYVKMTLLDVCGVIQSIEVRQGDVIYKISYFHDGVQHIAELIEDEFKCL